jgi:hypothetical protein
MLIAIDGLLKIRAPFGFCFLTKRTYTPHQQIRLLLPPDPVPPPIEIMRQRPRPHLAQAIQLRYPLDPNHNIPITHIFLTTKFTNYTNNEPVWILPLIALINTDAERPEAGGIF